MPEVLDKNEITKSSSESILRKSLADQELIFYRGIYEYTEKVIKLDNFDEFAHLTLESLAKIFKFEGSALFRFNTIDYKLSTMTQYGFDKELQRDYAIKMDGSDAKIFSEIKKKAKVLNIFNFKDSLILSSLKLSQAIIVAFYANQNYKEFLIAGVTKQNVLYFNQINNTIIPFVDIFIHLMSRIYSNLKYKELIKEQKNKVENINKVLHERTKELNQTKIKLLRINNYLESILEKRTQRIEEVNKALRISNEQLKNEMVEREKMEKQVIQESKMAAVGKLAAGVAHEINNPLAVIFGFTQSVLKRIKEGTPIYEPLKTIEREVERCGKLVNDLLVFSRTSGAKKEEQNLNDIIEKTLSLIETKSKMKNIAIEKDFANNIPKILIDKNQIQQVVVNLCNNAVDAMEETGGKLIVKTSLADNKKVVIIVTDTGKGIPKDIQKNVFEPFYTTKEIGKGTGLGLSLCYEIIEKHHGFIELESDINKGSTFTITLPLN